MEGGGRYKAWDAFYILATELAHKARGFEFETYVNNFMRDVVFPAFNGYLNSCQELRAKLTVKRECIKRIVSFDLNVTLDPDISYVTSLLPSVVKYAMFPVIVVVVIIIIIIIIIIIKY
jgi:N-glycosylase/DNA lyase